MKFQIKNRWTGAVQFECELSAESAGYIPDFYASNKDALADIRKHAGIDTAESPA